VSERSRAPRVSVVMAVHDGERYVGAAVDSVLAQTYRDLELIVVDDGSSDRSAAIVRERADPRVRIVTNARNVGLAPSLNAGIAEARGEFVARLDADDVALPGRFARQVEYLDAHPDVALLGSWYHEMAEDGTRGVAVRTPTRHWELRWHLHLYCPFAHSSVMWRRELVAKRVGGYDGRLAYSMDYDLWWRISAALRVAILPSFLVDLRAHGGSMTSTYGDRTREGLVLQAEHAARLLGWPAGDAVRDAERLQRLYRVLIGAPLDRTQPELLEDAAEVLHLHEAFLAAEAVPIEEASRQRREVRRQLARQRLWVSRTARANGRRGATAELLRAVVSLSPGALLGRAGIDAAIGVAARMLGRA
jgi:hypothetical protein